MRWLIFVLTLFLAGHAAAAESAAVTTSRDVASLVSDVDSVAAGRPFRLGLRLRMAPGWHTYWSNPGDAGAAPTLEVAGAQVGAILYPAPERLREGSFTSFAYTGELLLPVAATMAGAGVVEAHATWLICAKVCVPEEARFRLHLPAGDGKAGVGGGLFAAAEARMPRKSPFAAHVSAAGVLWVEAPHLGLRSASFFPAEAGLIDQGAAQALTVSGERIALALKLLKPPLRSVSGLLQLTDAGGQVENLTVDASAGEVPGGLAGVSPGLLRALVLAFAGGVILNLMPCVLPILAMKALALVRLGGGARRAMRRGAGLYTLGVVGAFCLIGGATLVLRAAGDAVGWGVQFQSVSFTTVTGWLLFATGLNLSGVFMVGGRLAGAGQGLASRGSFFTGLLAVVVATPCTAPFMGAALAAAFAMPAWAGMAVFVALGLGLAAPYAALALFPGVARLLPKPGAWMEVFKQLMAFPMYGAALWMVWVASQQTDAAGLAAVFASFLLIALAAWAYGFAQARERRMVPQLFAGAAVMAGVALLAVGAPAHAARGVAADGFEPYSAGRLAALREAGRPVLVDMGAAWCVTCLVNERVALGAPSVRAAFARGGVVYLRGDWTRQDAGITAFLREYDRSGVPLYVYFPAGGLPAVLPQILTPGVVLGVLAGG